MLIHWIWLATRPELNDRQKLLVLEAFRDPEDIYYADKDSYARVEGLTPAAVESLCDKKLFSARKILEDCVAKSIHICTFRDAAYPARLKNISDPPMILYYKGQMPDLDGKPVIGVVGTRKASAYGMTTAKRMGYQVARCGGIVVSGAASGIDRSAMEGALTAGCNVVGVLGCGADVVYPRSSEALYTDTERYGCLLTEFPPGTAPLKWNFPKRNRIISGLSSGVLVVEAPEGSGALITARHAAEQGRDVFVVPGNVDNPTCAGSNALLREGAICASSGWEIISEYASLYPDTVMCHDEPAKQTAFVPQEEKPALKVAQKPVTPAKDGIGDKKQGKKPIDKETSRGYSDLRNDLPALTEEERKIVDCLQTELLVDDIIAQVDLPAGTVLSTLTMLQIKGVIKQLPGNRVARR